MKTHRWRTVHAGALVAALLFQVGLSPTPVAAQGTCGCMDIAFVIDASGSMASAIDNVKTGLASIISGAQQASGGDLQMSVVRFSYDTEAVEIQQALTSNIGDVETAIMNLSAGGGNSEPESSDEALRFVVTGASACGTGSPGTLRAGCVKIALMVTDAPPGGCNDNFEPGVDNVNAAQVASLAAQAGVKIAAVQLLNGFSDDIETPIMQNYATATGGIFVQLPADGSGLSDAIESIIASCGRGTGKAAAPAMSMLPLGVVGIGLGALGVFRLRRRGATASN